MNNLSEIFDKKKIIIIIICITILSILGIYMLLNNNMTEIETFEEIEEDIIENDANETKVENQIEENNIKENYIEKEQIAIHIIGEIKKPGIIYLNAGSRIIDAINKAGGATKNAALDNVNLAYILEDGQKIYIPSKNEKNDKQEYIISNSGENVLIEEINKNTSKKGKSEKVNINTANQTELETLPGIGPSLAQRIIEYRQQNGEFQEIEEIQNVKGIGDSKYSNIKENICI